MNSFYVVNRHHSGGDTHVGVKDFTFWGSNSSASFDELTYGTDTGWTQLPTSASYITRHPSTNTESGQTISVTNAATYKYYAFKFANTHGHPNYIGIRFIELRELAADGGVAINVNGTEKARVAGSGYMGLDVEVPSHILHINGQGRSTVSTWATSSDQRVKENITDHEAALANILALRPVRFNFKKDYRPNAPATETGFLAQEFEQIIPEAVSIVEREEWNVPAKGRIFIPAEGENPEQELATNKSYAEYLAANGIGEAYEGATWEQTAAAYVDGLDSMMVLNTSCLLPSLVKAIHEQNALIVDLENRLTAHGI